MMQLSGNINATFDAMARLIPDIEVKTLNVGANYLKEQVKSAFVSRMPNANKPVRRQRGMRGYMIDAQDRLVDAVRQSKAIGGKVRIHILGEKKKGSAQFIARFYEYGTFAHNPRKQKTYKGKKLKKLKNLGKITGLHFFNSTIQQQIGQACNIMGRVYERMIDTVFNKK